MKLFKTILFEKKSYDYLKEYNSNLRNVKKMKTISLDLSRVRRHFHKMPGRQTDKQFFFSKTLKKRLFTPPSFFSLSRDKEFDKKPLKQLCDGRTDQRTDRLTD